MYFVYNFKCFKKYNYANLNKITKNNFLFHLIIYFVLNCWFKQRIIVNYAFCYSHIVPFCACDFSTQLYHFTVTYVCYILLFSTCCNIELYHCSLKLMLIIINNENNSFSIVENSLLAQIITDRPSPGSTTMDDVLNSLLGLQQQGSTNNNTRYHHRGDSSSGDFRQKPPYAASGMANV